MATAKPKLTFKNWWDHVGTENVQAVCSKLKTSMAYMRQLRYRTKRPSYDRATAIIGLAKEITPGFVPDMDLLMEPLPARESRPRKQVKPPSPEFLRAQARRAKARASA